MTEVDYLISGGQVVDGTGAPPRRADVAVRGDRITAVERDLGALEARERIDATGCFVTPGIVDIHSHADWTLTVDGGAESAVLQGISTIVPGQCGHGVAPVADPAHLRVCAFGLDRHTDAAVPWRTFGEWLACLRGSRTAVNVVPLVAHGAVRLATMGTSTAAADDEQIQAMRAHVEEAMAAGAAGISTGLEYQPGQSASQAELSMVAEMAGAHEGLYATHSRNRTSRIEQSAVEAIDIARQAGCRLQLSHFLPRPYVEKAAFERALERMERARESGMAAYSDVHPHLIGPGPLAQMLPAWAWQAGPTEIPALMRDGAWRRRVLDDLDPRMREYLNSGVADGMLIVHAPGSEHVVGSSLGALARATGTTPDEAAMDLMRDAGEDFYAVTELETWTTREDMDRFLANEHYMLMGDGVTLASHGKLARFSFLRRRLELGARAHLRTGAQAPGRTHRIDDPAHDVDAGAPARPARGGRAAGRLAGRYRGLRARARPPCRARRRPDAPGPPPGVLHPPAARQWCRDGRGRQADPRARGPGRARLVPTFIIPCTIRSLFPSPR